MSEVVVPKEILDRVDAMAKTIGTTADMLFQRLCEDSVRFGMLELGYSGIMLLMVIACVITAFKSTKHFDQFETGGRGLAMLIPSAAFGLFSLVGFLHISCFAIEHIGTPTAYAIKSLGWLFK